MHSWLRFSVVLIASLGMAACALVIEGPKIGVSNSDSSIGIERVNDIAALRQKGLFSELVSRLRADEKEFIESTYSRLRIINELADVYSNQLFDIEQAVIEDERLKSMAAGGIPDERFLPSVGSANQKILGGREYIQEYLAISETDLRAQASARLSVNAALLKGMVSSQGARSVSYLNEQLSLVLEDLQNAPPKTLVVKRLISRLIRLEFELNRAGVRSSSRAIRYVSDLNSVDDIDWSELSFLQFAKWVESVGEATEKRRLLDLALVAIYKPYVNLRSPNARWLYNNIVNGYIDQLVKANFEAGRYDEALYYASLNKSRAVLEERLIYEQIKGGTNTRLADLYAQDSVPRDKIGLPSKEWFRQQLAKAPAYLDFYVSGQFEEGKGKAANTRQSTTVARAERAVMPPNARDFGVEGASATSSGSFQDKGMYVFQVQGGKVQSARRVAGAELAQLKGDLNVAFDQVSGAGPSSRNARALLSAYGSGMPERYAVSVDKWLSRHPLEMHLNAKVSRTLNFFTLSEPTRLNKLSVAGFFDPLGDLAGARAEAEVIETVVPGSLVRKGAQASVAELRNARSASVVHLSMHGFFDEQNPNNSKLAFAGARKDGKPGDPNALYAKDMVAVDALRNRDLVFAAACKSGVVASDSANQNELMGILRPLTANRNRNVILSLWNVNDASAKDFVEAFYRSLGSTLNVDEAFFAAQAQVREKYRDPYHWAAFYLSKAN